ncbi:MAG: serine--tRNA ligase, partial [Armatimonadota bacterium]
MLDIKLIRTETDFVKKALGRRGYGHAVDDLIDLDENRRKLIAQVEDLKAERNKASEEIARVKKDKGDAAPIIARMKAVSDQIKELDQQVKDADAALLERIGELPNLPHDSVPDGKGDEDNVEIERSGEPPVLDFEPKPHWDLANDLGMVDFERGTKLAGSGFILYKGAGARLERALISFMLDMHITHHGYTEVWPPYLALPSIMYGTGKLPKFKDDMYWVSEDDLYLNPTAEVPITCIHMEEILPPGTLPVKYTGYCASFRREAGAAGKDTRGLIRIHQFDKVEMVQLTEPDKSYEALEEMLQQAKNVVEALGLTYRILNCCAGDIGQAASKMYDVEIWAPGLGKWLEVSSVSNCTDYQARRANIRFRTEAQGKPEFAHTLNGSGIALPRT